jgi:rod shape-determining protein MreC
VATRHRPRSTRLLVVVLLSISLAVITLDYRQGSQGPLAGLGRGATTLMAPLQKAVTRVTEPVGDFFSGLTRLPSLENRVQELTAENDGLRAQIQQHSFQDTQYHDLLATLALRDRLEPESVAASVIASGVDNFQWSVRIDAGSDDEIMVDDVVIAGGGDVGGRLVGVVTQVTPNASVVQLVVDPRTNVAAVLGTTKVGGLVTGQGEGDLHMLGVDPEIEVEGDESVFTLGYSTGGKPGLYPPGILIGQVSRATSSDTDLEEFITVRPAVDFSTLDIVLVLETAEREA